MHQGFVFALVPDHLILSTTTWTFIGILFSEGAGRWLSLVLLALPMALFIWEHFAEPVTVPPGLEVPARRRLFRKAILDQRVERSLPVLLFLLCIVSVWFVQKGDSSAAL